MHKPAVLVATTFALILAGCGSKAEGPVEQIVVRQPGEPAAAASAAAPAAGDLVAQGKAAFASCATCHSVAPGGPSQVGPNLFGVVDRPAGSLPGFAYSPAMKASGITWTVAELDAFLANPSGKVSGTVMPPVQLSDAKRRAAIVAYLASLKP